jgi:5-methyltetrahydropteroyltriglutamate--homocysteine methyltransferase
LVLELCTPRAGDLRLLSALPEDRRLGVGVVDQKSARVETPEELVDRAQRAVDAFGPERVLLNPDCGFATFADNPIASASIAEGKLAALSEASRRMRERYG